jgi:glycosyltransferase involved in cell wall biosynthesis
MFFFNSVYNRPEEVDELLESLSKSDYNEGFEVVIIEDGSSLKCEEVVKNIRVN